MRSLLGPRGSRRKSGPIQHSERAFGPVVRCLIAFAALSLALGSKQRSIECQTLGVRVAEVKLDGPVHDIVWLTGGVVFVITKERTLYRSADDGRTFANVNEQLEDADTEEDSTRNGVLAMHPSDADPARVFFKGGGTVHWVTYNGGRTFHAIRPRLRLHEVKLHRTDPEAILATKLSDVCSGLSTSGFCYQSLYISYNFGTTWKEVVQYVQQFAWGPRDETVVYSAFGAGAEGHQFLQDTKNLNVYRSADMFHTTEHIRMVVRRGVGFKVSKSGVYVAVGGDQGTMQLFQSRDDAQSFLPVIFPSPLRETRYTILDEDNGAVFISVEHPRDQDAAALEGHPSATLGDIYASVPDGEVLFNDDFEGGLNRWRGRHRRAVPAHASVVADPLCKDGKGCRGKVLRLDGCSARAKSKSGRQGGDSADGGDGDVFSVQSIVCSAARPCKVSYWFLGRAWQGFAEGFPGRHVWTAGSDAAARGLHHRAPMEDGSWTPVEFVFPRPHGELAWAEAREQAAERAGLGRGDGSGDALRVMFEAHGHGCNATYFDDVRITRARSEDFVVALRNGVRDEVGHVDLQQVQGLDGLLVGNAMTRDGAIKTLFSDDDGNQWRPLTPPEDHTNHICQYRHGNSGPWKDPRGHDCSLHLHLGHKIKGSPGKWEFRHHLELDQRFGPFVSARNAIGVLVAVGNIGTELAEDASELTTFVSRDGGVTWKEAAKGSTSSDIGDQGSIIVMADNTQPTKDITMSIDGGVSFRQCEFTGGTKIDVRDVLVDPNATSTNFIIHGHELAYERAGDPGSDFELWSFKGEDEPCLMGKQVDFVRRKPNAGCYVGAATRLATLERACECEEADYECDFCYERMGETEAAMRNLSATACVWSCAPGDEGKVPEPCPGTFVKSAGYRKIGGNTCQGGVDLTPQRVACPRGASSGTGGNWLGGGGTGALVAGGLGWGGGLAAVAGVGASVAVLAVMVKTVQQRGVGAACGAAWCSITGILPGGGRAERGSYGYTMVATDDFALADELSAYADEDLETPFGVQDEI